RRPAELRAYQRVVRVPATDPLRPGNVPHREVLPRDVHDHPGEVADADHLVRSDVDGTLEARAREAHQTLDALEYVEEGAGLLGGPPDLDETADGRLGDLPADSRWRLLTPASPRAFGSEDVVEAGDPYRYPVVPGVGEVQAFAE